MGGWNVRVVATADPVTAEDTFAFRFYDEPGGELAEQVPKGADGTGSHLYFVSGDEIDVSFPVSAVDAVGNESAKISISFRADRKAPAPPGLSIVSATYVA